MQSGMNVYKEVLLDLLINLGHPAYQHQWRSARKGTEMLNMRVQGCVWVVARTERNFVYSNEDLLSLFAKLHVLNRQTLSFIGLLCVYYYRVSISCSLQTRFVRT